RAAAAARNLAALGLGAGDTLALFAGTCVEWVDAWLGAPAAGVRTVPLNLAYRGEYLRNLLVETRSKAILTDTVFLPAVMDIAGTLPDLRTVIVITPHGRAAPLDPPSSRLAVVPAEALQPASAPAMPAEPLSWKDPATVMYTSGTTGPSKGALLSQHYLCTCATVLNHRYGTTADDVMYAAVPLFHISGSMFVVLGSLTSGRSSALDSAFHPTTTWDRVRQYDASQFFGVGAMIAMLYNLPPSPDDAKLPVRLIIGAPIPAELHQPLEARYDCKVVAGYALSEATPIATHDVNEPRVPGTVGRPVPLFDVELLDDDDGPVPAGAVGEIAVRPRYPHVMFEGYLDRPADTLAQCRNLWFHTGDLGRFDEQGLLAWVDRKKDAIRRRGENISSFEVESAVLRHPAVLECAALGVPSDLGEEDVKICVVLRPGQTADPAALVAHCADLLPRFAVPRYVEFVPFLPKNQVGRVLKHELRADPLAGGTWDGQA
ncbi:MAG TPA: AMP-binding protein, partial [Acidimicrobiia bacterium]|nr:AMP-binding protein [Acidimicrobiia bacterium]